MDFALTQELEATRALAELVATEVVAPAARAADAEGRFDRSVIEELGRRGLLNVMFPGTYGGVGLGSQAMSLVYEELGRVDSSVRGCATVTVGLVGQCILAWGSDEQKDRWLPDLAAGRAIGGYALTEPDVGSDVKSLRTRAERSGDGWILTGDKHWITNGNVADVLIVFAASEIGLTAFLLPRGADGVITTPMKGRELGHRGSDHARMRLEGVRVGSDAALGEVGSGFQVAMGALEHGRLGVAAGALGVLRSCVDATTHFARTRRQFGRRIGDFEMIQASIADMAADLAAARLLVRHAAWLRDEGFDAAQATAIAKLFCTEAALRAADQAILIHGARGYSNEYPVERYWRDAKGMQIYEGTAHIQRVIIARSLLGHDDHAPGP